MYSEREESEEKHSLMIFFVWERAVAAVAHSFVNLRLSHYDRICLRIRANSESNCEISIRNREIWRRIVKFREKLWNFESYCEILRDMVWMCSCLCMCLVCACVCKSHVCVYVSMRHVTWMSHATRVNECCARESVCAICSNMWVPCVLTC